jgi:hypothetical protein
LPSTAAALIQLQTVKALPNQHFLHCLSAQVVYPEVVRLEILLPTI